MMTRLLRNLLMIIFILEMYSQSSNMTSTLCMLTIHHKQLAGSYISSIMQPTALYLLEHASAWTTWPDNSALKINTSFPLSRFHTFPTYVYEENNKPNWNIQRTVGLSTRRGNKRSDGHVSRIFYTLGCACSAGLPLPAFDPQPAFAIHTNAMFIWNVLDLSNHNCTIHQKARFKDLDIGLSTGLFPSTCSIIFAIVSASLSSSPLLHSVGSSSLLSSFFRINYGVISSLSFS